MYYKFYHSLHYTLLLFLSLIFSLEEIQGQPFRSLKLNSIHTTNGLSDNHVNYILKDEYGKMWFGTDKGLNQYDGIRTKNYYSSADSHSIAGNTVTQLILDKKDQLIVVSENGIVQYNPLTDDFTTLLKKSHPINPHSTFKISFDSENNIWFSKKNTFVRLGKGNISDSIPLPLEYTSKNTVSSIITHDIDSKNRLWFSTPTYLLYYDITKKSFHTVLNFEEKMQNPYDLIKQISHDNKDNIWLGTSGGSIFKVNGATLQYYSLEAEHNTHLSNITQIFCKNNVVYYVINNIGIAQYIPKEDRFITIKNSFFELPHNKKVTSIYPTTNHDFWIGNERKGVQFVSTNNPISIVEMNYKGESNNSFISSILMDKNRNLWVGTDDEGLFFKPKQTEKFLPTKAILPPSIQCIYENRTREIWVGTYRQGIHILDGKTHQLKTSLLPDSDVRKIIQDNNGLYWIVTHGKGIVSYNSSKKIIKSYNTKTTPELVGDWTYDVLFTEKNNLWIASNNGISHLSLTTDTINNFYSDQRHDLGLSGNVYCLLKPVKNKLWCGTAAGLVMVDLSSFSSTSGLDGIIVNSLTKYEDKIFAGTSNGIYLLSSTGEIIHHFTIQDGLPSNYFNQKAAIVDSTGKLYIGGNKGLVIFNPKQLVNKHQRQNIKLTSITINNESVFERNRSHSSSFNIHKDRSLSLEYAENNLTFCFGDLNYSLSHHNTFFYQLQGFENTWQSTTAGEAKYNNLSPGDYIFVLAKEPNINNGQHFQVMIHPPFWKSWWAYLLYTITAGVVLFFIYRIISLRNKITIERIRHEEHDKLNNFKMTFFTQISHDIRTPLTLINGPLDELLALKPEEQYMNRLKLMKKSSDYLMNLVNELLDFKKLESTHYKLHIEPEAINDLTQEIVEEFKLAALQKNIQLNFEAPQSVYANVDKSYYKKCIYNLVSNAIKFTPEQGEIIVSVKKHGAGELEIKVKNSGKEVSQEVKDNLFNEFYIAPNTSNTGFGIGLSIVKSIVEQHHGKLSIENNNGVEITICLAETEAPHFLPQSTLKTKKNTPLFNLTVAKQLTVLIVEDNSDLRDYLQSLLYTYYTVITAKNGKEGLEIANEHSPDIILSDVNMPEINGLEFCERLRNSLETSHIPVVLLTAKAMVEDELLGLKMGAVDYITKPFTPEILLHKLSNVLHVRTQQHKQFSLEKEDFSHFANNSIDQKFTDTFLKLIETEYGNSELSVEKMADHLAMTRGSLNKKCQALFGQSPSTILEEKRILIASKLLKETDLSVSEIAYQVGYSDPKQFSKRFKFNTSFSPSELRK